MLATTLESKAPTRPALTLGLCALLQAVGGGLG